MWNVSNSRNVFQLLQFPFYLKACLNTVFSSTCSFLFSTDITNFTRSPAAGQNFTYWCKCKEKASPSKSICKGEDPSICQTLVTTNEPDKNKKISINDKDKTNITVTIRNVTADDSGTYWCRAKNDNQQICNRLILTVGESRCFILWVLFDMFTMYRILQSSNNSHKLYL